MALKWANNHGIKNWMLGFTLLFSVTVFSQPTITNFSPNSGPVGTLVTITGTNLSNPTGITIAGVSAIPISNNGNTLVAMVMPGATFGSVNVTTGGGTATGPGNFSVTASLVPNSQQGNKLVGTGNVDNAYQGISVAISADGNTAVVGGIYDNSLVGAAWIFTRSGGAWVQQGNKLVGTDAIGGSQQGYSVAISADGNTVIVGGYTDNSNEGAAWIFTRSGGAWTQQGTKLVGTGASGNAYQGTSVALSADGNTAIVGGHNDGGDKGAIWIFTRIAGVWTQQGSKLVGSGATGNARQGWSVALSADGNTAMVGGYRDNGNAGASWIYTRSGGVWTQQGTKLVGTGAAGNANQGISVSLSADGNTAIVGGVSDNSNVGASWIFTRSGSTWTQQGNKLVGTGAVGNSYQGYGVSLSADGNIAVVGAYGDNGNSGAAWIFARNGTNWTQLGMKLVGTGANGNAQQGRSVAISADGNTAIVGGYGDNSNSGASWVYIYLPPPPTIISFTPTVAATGTLISITGTNFENTSVITLGGTPVSAFTVVSSTSILAIVGSGSTGAVSLTTPGGTASLNGFTFIPPPTITSFAPASTGAGRVITISGTNFIGTSAITLGGTPVTSFTVISSTSIVAIVGAGSSGAVSLTTPGGSASLTGFTFIPAPTITAFTPGTAAAGALISITGTNFDNTSVLTLGGTPVTSFTVVSATSIVAIVGSGSSGAVSLTTPGGTASLAGFTFIPAPTITSFTPTIAAAGTLINITGANFDNTSAITLGGTPVSTFTVVSSTSIIAIVGSGSSGAVSLTTPGGTASLNGFIFIPAPTITLFSPAITGAGAVMSITGTNFLGTTAITLGGTPVTSFTVISSTSIVAIVGAGSSGAVSLTTPGGTASLAGFIFSPPPSISSFTATTGPVGTLVTITGTNLNYPQSIMIGGVSAIPISNDGTTLVAMVMPGATTGGVSVTTPGGTANGSGNFVVIPTQFPNFQQGAKLTGSGITSSAYLGWSVALSADGNTAIVGSPVDNALIGAALIYVRTGNTWTQQAKLVGSGNIGIAQQGTGVAISADGNTAIVGGNRDNDFVGAAWIFTRNGGTWTQQGNKLVGSDAVFRSNQGWSVDLSADGNTALIGGLGDLGGIGAAWIFTRSGGIWTQQGSKLVGTGGVGLSYQGWSVSISADANTAIIGGYVDDNLKGAAWVFVRSGNNWVQQGNKLVGSGAIGAAQQGWSISISSDGNTAIIGGNADDNSKGAAWIFTRNAGTWSQQGNKLIGSSAIGNATQGKSVSVSADGNTAIIGGSADNGGAGAAWTFTRMGNNWFQKCSKLVGSGSAGAANQGESIALSADGNTAFIGGFIDNGGDGAAWSFIHIPPPELTNFTPTAAATGNVITITGSFLTNTTAVTLGGTPVDAFTVVSSNTINAKVGSGSSGAVSVISVGCEATLNGFSYIPAPIITSFSPTAAGTGALITITGSYFDNTFVITLGGTQVTSFTVISSTTIVAIVGSGSTGAVSLTTPGGTASLAGFTYIPPPTITSFTPTTAATGTLINITGTNFDNTFAITLGGTPVSSFTVVSSTSIIAVVGGGSTGAVSLTTPGGRASLDGFTFIPAPTITSFAPTTAAAGALINITGTNFNNTFAITLGGTPVNSFTVVSSTSIIAIVGSGSTGAVSLTTPGGTASLDGFTYIPPPTITSFTPTTAATGTLINITGTNFNNTFAITLGGTPVTSFTVVSATSIVAIVGTGSSGAVSLTTPGGTASLAGFTFIPAPTITAFAPITAAAGALINITGTNFNGTSIVTLGGTTVSAFTVVSATSIVAIVGTGSTGAVSLTTPGGTASLAGFTFIPAPTITSFAPTSAGAGALISITGTNFNGTSIVTLGGTPVTTLTVVSATSIVAIVGTGSSGAVSLTTPGGTASLAGFTFIPAPTITSFAPITAAAGALISITGTNFDNTIAITLGGTPVTSFTVVSATSIVAIVGTGSSGAVSLTTPGGTASLAGFTFIPAPTITAFAPITAAAGALINITGTNFNGTSIVTLGGTTVSAFTVVSATSIVAIVGTGSTGAVSLTTPGGTASLAGFTFIPAPTITSFAPTTAAAGALINITGTNFNNTFTITLGGTPVTSFTVVSATSIVAIVGTGSTGAVSLTTPGGTASLAGFTFIPAPTISSFAPTTAAAGALINITGTNFNNTFAITLGGTPVTSFTVVSATSIVAIVGTGSTGAVSLTTPGGTASLAGFTFIPAPTITAFAPTTAAAGALINFTGTNFNNTYAITLGGTPVTSFTVVSATSIVAIVGTGSTGAVSLTTPGGTASLAGFTFIPAPTITSFAPTTAAAGTLINITGTHFDNTYAITLGGTPVTSFTVVSATSIVAIVGTGSSGALSLTTPGGSASLAGFTFIPAPTITTFAPTTAAAGTLINITGTHFDNTYAITLGGTPVNSFTVVSSTSIIAVVGSGSTGAVSLTTPGGTASLAGFTFIPAPTITSFAPTSAGAGALISITGTNFNGTSIVTLGGTPVTTFTVVSATSIVARVSSGSTGAVSLTTPGGTASLAGFTFIPAPTITSFAPTTAAAGALINITGTNFNNAFAITLGGIPVTSFTVVSATSIVAIVGTGSTGAVSLTTPGGTASLAGFTFIPAPTITSFAPTTAAAGALISITGTNFNNTFAITLGGTPVTSFTVVSATSIVAIVGTGSTGAVSLTTPGGTASLGGFNFIPAPTITSFAPTAAGAGALISITGTNLNGTSIVTLGGTPVSAFTVVSSTSIVARVSSGSTGAVSLTTPGGTASLAGFTFIPAPTITSFAPTTAAAGALINITGTNFNNTFAITLGGTPVTSFTVVSATSIVAIVGTGSTGAVSLTTPGGTASLNGFTFIPAPTITSFAPTTAAAGALINITGTNFNGTSILTLGGTPVTSFTVVSATSIIAIVGTGSSGAVSLTTPGGTASLAGFTFIPAPTITSFAPTSAGAGALISITGTNFNGTSIVTLGGTPVTTFTVVSATSIVARVSSGSTGAVSLTTPGGTASLAGFTFIPAPTITSFAPTTAAAGAVINITGTNFNNTFAITLGGTPVTSFTVVSATSIVAVVGTGSTGAVSLTTPGGTASLAGFTFIPAPTITSFAPQSAGAGALITITGTNLNGTLALTLGGTPVTSFTVVSSTTIVAIVGTGSSGAVSLTTPGGTASLAGFTFISPPTIASFTPQSAGAGALITITGTNLNGTLALTLGGTPVTSFTVVSSTTIVAVVGSGSTGAVSLTTPGGTASLAGFTFIPAPTITSFDPSTAAVGALLNIAGTNFDGTYAITLGGTPVSSFTVVSSTYIVAVVGSGATGAVSLTTPGGTASLAGFTFIPAPIITSFAPTAAASGMAITITGNYFTGTSIVTLGGTPVASFIVLSSTTIVAIVGTGSSGAVSLTTPGGSASLAGFTFLLYPPNFIPEISNAFSPNGDGINDVWLVNFLQDYPNATVQIVNRYGQIVFFSNGYAQPWDGKFKGQALPVGTYYYLINLRNGKPTIAGSVTIIR